VGRGSSFVAALPMRFRTASRTFALPFASTLCLSAAVMLMPEGAWIWRKATASWVETVECNFTGMMTRLRRRLPDHNAGMGCYSHKGVRIWDHQPRLQVNKPRLLRGTTPRSGLLSSSRRDHRRLGMARDQYFVVLHDDKWKIKHNDQHSDPYPSQAAAVEDAIARAKRAHDQGELTQVLVQG
jgi:hypothetical protein